MHATITADPVRRDLLDPGTDLLVLPARQAWMADAACIGRTPLFFGMAGERPERRIRREARARQVCAGCPVREPCREMARLNGENGFWGGESEEERAAAGYAPVSISRRSVQRAAAGAPGHRQAC
jgi:WhiB family redox-sensing transcriptional regulator